MRRRSLVLFFITLFIIVAPATRVHARWHSIDERAFLEEHTCRNGFSFGIAAEEGEIYAQAYLGGSVDPDDTDIVFREKLPLSSSKITTDVENGVFGMRWPTQSYSDFFAKPWTKKLPVGTTVHLRWLVTGTNYYTHAQVQVQDCFLPNLSSASSPAHIIGTDNRLAYDTTISNTLPGTLETITNTEEITCSGCPIYIYETGFAKSDNALDEESVFVRGSQSTITHVTVHISLSNNFISLSNSHADNLDIWLQGPNGKRVMLMSDAGGSGPLNADLSFDDSASATPPDETPIASDTYKPSNYQGDHGSSDDYYNDYSQSLSTFTGINPNGQWHLLIVNDDPNGIPNGVSGIAKWSLQITTVAPAVTVTDTLPSNMTFVSAEGDGWTCSYANGVVTCTRATLPPNAPPFEVVVQAPNTSTPFAHTTSVVGIVRDIDPTNDTLKHPTSIAPSVVAQPSNTRVLSDQTATLTVVATGTAPLSYQWYSGSNGDTSKPIKGGTRPVYTTPKLSDSASYWVQVRNGVGVVNSATAIVSATPDMPSIDIAPSLVVQPSSITLTSNQTATLEVIAKGTAPLAYQWYIGSSGDTSRPIIGATSSTYTTPELSDSASYWVQVSNDVGVVNSATAIVSVTPDTHPTSIAPSIVSRTMVVSNQTATLEVVAEGTAPLAYQWYIGSSGDTSRPIIGATSSTYITPELSDSASYWVQVSNGVGVVNSVTMTISVTPHTHIIFLPTVLK